MKLIILSYQCKKKVSYFLKIGNYDQSNRGLEAWVRLVLSSGLGSTLLLIEVAYLEIYYFLLTKLKTYTFQEKGRMASLRFPVKSGLTPRSCEGGSFAREWAGGNKPDSGASLYGYKLNEKKEIKNVIPLLGAGTPKLLMTGRRTTDYSRGDTGLFDALLYT
jgi:hypothetical protein